MSAARTARERVRAELTREIKEVARAHLADVGASALSLRAVARDLGMASSAIYRYYPSRDELLTVLIIDAYDAVGAAAEAGGATRAHDDFFGRWLAACRAVRRWALDNPHEYALIYGSPVPGYRAPRDTVGPASRVALVLIGLLEDASRAGALTAPPDGLPVPPAVTADVRAVLESLERDHDLPPHALARGVLAWIHLYGTVSFELFGHLHGVIEEREAFFDFSMTCMAAQVGLPAPPSAPGASSAPGAAAHSS